MNHLEKIHLTKGKVICVGSVSYNWSPIIYEIFDGWKKTLSQSTINPIHISHRFLEVDFIVQLFRFLVHNMAKRPNGWLWYCHNSYMFFIPLQSHPNSIYLLLILYSTNYRQEQRGKRDLANYCAKIYWAIRRMVLTQQSKPGLRSDT